MAFLVEYHCREEFMSWEKIKSLEALKLGLPTGSRYYHTLVKSLIPRATMVPLESIRSFFLHKAPAADLDALVYATEADSAWTLVYPRYSVSVPFTDPVVIPLAYALPRQADDSVTFVNTWLALKQKDGTMALIFKLETLNSE